MNDLRHALRSLRRAPGFAAVTVLTLALGIGVNTSLFTLVDALFLQPLPVASPRELVMVMQRGDLLNVPYGHSYADYVDVRQGMSAFSALAAFMPTPVHLSAPGQTPERTWIEVVSPNYFELAKVTPAWGQLLRAGEGEAKSAAPTIVLSHRYWQRRFGGDPSVIGRMITLNGRGFTVIGVAPPRFSGLSWAMAVSGWVPSGAVGTLLEGGDSFLTNRGAHAFRMMGRLAPGKTLAEARADMGLVSARMYAAYPDAHKGSKVIVASENRSRPDPSVAEFLPVFAAIFAAMVALVLFIACANVANLMLSRSVARHRDLTIRSALGARRLELVRLGIMESVVLAALAGLLGLVLARLSGQALAAFVPAGDIPVNTDHPWDWRVYVFTFLVSAAAGVAAGLWPALESSRVDLGETLKEGGGPRSGFSRHPVLNLLVVGQVTLSVVILSCAALFWHSLSRMQGMALGFRTENILMMSLDLGLQQYGDERGRQFLDQLLQRTAALPGVRSATLTRHVPVDYGIQISEVATDGEIAGSKDGYVSTAFTAVGPGFFETTGTAIRRGRSLGAGDDERSPLVAVVNETMARTLWPGAEAVGKRFRFGRDGRWMEVVGVAADGKYVMLAEAPRSYFYLALAQNYASPVTLMVRSAGDPSSLARPVQDVLRQMDPDLPVFNLRTMDRHVRESVFGLMPLRMAAAMAAIEGLLGLFLAVMGLYAVVSYAASRRVHEIGVRMALGARPRDVRGLVVRGGMRLALIGVAIGLLLAVGAGLALSHVLYGVERVAAGVLAPVAVLLLGVAALACYLPARRATRVDPVVALRCE
jgi:putative ABC transport system permease protein